MTTGTGSILRIPKFSRRASSVSSRNSDLSAATWHGRSTSSDSLQSSESTNAATMYGYGDSTTMEPDYGYGPATSATPQQPDYGYGDAPQPDYGYRDAQPDYGYGDDHAPAAAAVTTTRTGSSDSMRPRPRRRNSCVVRKDAGNPLAVAEYLMGGPPRMSDRDMANTEGGIITT